jgi:TonB family protein
VKHFLVGVAIFSVCMGMGFNIPAAMGAEDQLIIDRSTKNQNLNNYVLLTRDAIQRSWTTPTEFAATGALKGKIGINYVVKRSGAVDQIELVRGSGNTDLDNSLIQAIHSAAPFPPFPRGVEAQTIMIRANFIVADLPTVPVLTANHDIPSEGTTAPASKPESAPKKYIWGAAAGNPGPEQKTENVAPAAPVQKKFKWGLQE